MILNFNGDMDIFVYCAYIFQKMKNNLCKNCTQKNSGQYKCPISSRSIKWHQFEEILTIQNTFLVLNLVFHFNIIDNLIWFYVY